MSTNKVFLRPTEFQRPVEYQRSVAKAGLVVLPQQNLALYTLSAGPQGPAGIDQNSLFDTIIASASDEFSPIDVDLVVQKTTWRAPYSLDLTNGYVRMSLTTAPTGADFIVDVKINDPANPGNPSVSLFTTLLRIDAGEKTSVTSAIPAVIDPTKYIIADDTEFQTFVTQVGSTLTGTGLKVAVTGIKVE
jgi:hypothetical protein